MLRNAVAGQIAGAIYGLEGIPDDWVSELVEGRRILDLGEQVFEKRYQRESFG
jgi:ADP-ribosyl-[dinitrogen reductase] hydrolase